MTLDEKIEILKAYSEGKTVEELVESCGMTYWRQVTQDNWYFELNQYRIKPNSEPKFKVGNILLDLGEEGKANPSLYRCTGVSNNWYYFDGGIERTKEFVHNHFIDIDEVLWFFTGITSEDTRVLLNDVMCTNLEAIKTYGESIYNIEPIYAMGFRQKVTEKDKETTIGWERVEIDRVQG